MTPERWKQIQENLDIVSNLAPSERRPFLDQMGRTDLELCQEVESLLSYESKDPEVLQTAALRSLVADECGMPKRSSLLGRTFGPYRLTELLGAGGMGEVYRAVRADGQYDQEVALKIVRSDFAGALIARFRNERQILASLDHPNIARILDGSTTEDGIPYVVMELIEGLPITEYCDQHHLPIDERLKLFRVVCSAVHYAHQHLVVHRDIKPSNILVTADGTPKLLDFGIAKILGPNPAEQNVTQPGLMMMTPEYASPEQLRGEPITTATDGYSLGLVLYELLTGYQAFHLDGKMPHEIARGVLEMEPEKPSGVSRRTSRKEQKSPAILGTSDARDATPDKLSRMLSGDIDSIVLKTLRKDPQDRYSSVDQLSEDIRRHLEGLPVLARKGTLSYRVSKYVLRHKAAVASAVLIFLILATGIVITLREARIAKRNELRAERRFNDVRKLANSLLFEIHDNIRDLPGATAARKVLLDHSVEYLDSLAQESSGDPGLQRELAAAYERLGDVQGMPNAANLGESSNAARSYNKAIALLESLQRSGAPSNRDLLQLSGICYKMSALVPDLHEAAEHAARAASIATTVANSNGPEVDEALAKLVRADVGVGDVYWDMNSGFPGLGDPQRALPYYQKAMEIDAKLLERRPDDRYALGKKAVIEERFARVLMQTGHRGEAMADLESASSISNSLAARYKDYDAQRLPAISDGMVGDLLVLDGRFVEAISQYREALKIWALLAQDTNNLDAACGGAYAVVGYSLARSGKIPEGLSSIEKGIGLDQRCVAREAEFAPARSGLASDYVWYAALLQHLGRKADALREYRKARDLFAALANSNQQDIEVRLSLGATNTKIAGLEFQSGLATEAREILRDVIASTERIRDLSNEQVRYTLAEAYAGLGDIASGSAIHQTSRAGQISDLNEARSWYEKSLGAWNELTDPGPITPKGFPACDLIQIRNGLKSSEATLARLRR